MAARTRYTHKETMPKPLPEEEEYVPDLRELVTSPMANKIGVLVTQYSVWGAQKAEAAKEQKKIQPTLKKLIEDSGAFKFRYADSRVSYYPTKKRKLDPKLLMERGVSPTVIAACYTEETFYSLRVTTLGEEEEDG